MSTSARWSRATQDDIFYNLTRDPKKHDAAIAAGKEMAAYLPKLFAKRRKAKNLPQSKDAVSRLLATHFVGTIGWDDQRMMSNVMGLLVGAVETNNAAIAQAVDEFLERMHTHHLGIFCGAVQKFIDGDLAAIDAFRTD